MKKMKLTFKQFKELIIAPPIWYKSNNDSYEFVKSYHISCASRKTCDIWNCSLEQHNYGEVVLYMKDGKTDWYCNNRHCKIGYIIIKPVEDIKNITSKYGIIHGKTYKSVFNEEPINIVGSGFARCNGIWKWNSGSFNLKSDKYHTLNSKSMNEIEAKWIEKAVKNWHDTGNQNTNVDESVVIYKN